MAERQPERGPAGLRGADIAKFLAALLVAIGLGSLVDYIQRRSGRTQAEREQRGQAVRAAEIERKRAQGHQSADLRVGPLVGVLAATVVIGAVICVGLWGLLYVLSSRATQADVPLSPLGTAVPAPEPRLQADPPADWQRMRATDEAILGSSGQSTDGTVHISIDRAMDLLAQRGLPVMSGAQTGLSDAAAHGLESDGGQPPGGIPEPQSQPGAGAPTAGTATPQPAGTTQPEATPTPTRSAP
ncbi:MAG: hypothetical protein ABI901_02130 [Roseiflexaceae bacterium]